MISVFPIETALLVKDKPEMGDRGLMASNWGQIQELRSRVPREYKPWDEPAALTPGYVRDLGDEPEADDTITEAEPAADAEIRLEAKPRPDGGLDFDWPSAADESSTGTVAPVAAAKPEPASDPTPVQPPKKPAIFKFAPPGSTDPIEAETAAAVTQPNVSARETELTRFNLGTGFNDSETDAPSFILSGAAASRRDADLARVQEKRKDEERSAFDRAREALEERLRQLDAEIAAIDKRRAEIADRRAEIKDSVAAVDELDELARTGKLDPNNPAHAKLLRRAGISKDEAKSDNIADILARRRAGLGNEDGALGREDDALERRREEVSRERERVQQQADKLDAQARAGVSREALTEQIASRASTTQELREVGSTAYHAETAAVKTAAADAVARNEAAPLREDSEDFTRQAVKDVAVTLQGSGAGFDMDAPLVSASAASAVGPTPIKAAALTPTFTTASDPAAQPVQSAANDIDAALIRPPTSPVIKAG